VTLFEKTLNKSSGVGLLVAMVLNSHRAEGRRSYEWRFPQPCRSGPLTAMAF